MDKAIERVGAYLSENLKRVRELRGMTQAQLAALAELPRSTLANIEAGGSNPTLGVLLQLAGAVQLSVEELLSRPRGGCQYFPKGSLPVIKRRGGAVEIHKLLPHSLPGMEIDRIVLGPLAKMVGAPHRPGTHEYLYCAQGAIKLWVSGEGLELETGDVASFPGDQRHSYQNRGRSRAVGFSVVALAPEAPSRFRSE